MYEMGFMGFMGLMGLMDFFYSTMLFEVTFFPFDEAANQHVALVDKGYGYVGYGLVGAVFDLLSVYGRVEMCFAECSGLYASEVVVCP